MLPTLFCWRSTAQAIKVETNLAAQCSTTNRCLANPTPNPVPGGQASRRTTCPTPRSTTYPNPRIGAPTSLRQCSYSNNRYSPHKALRTGRPPPTQRQSPEAHEPSRQMQRQSADKVQDFSSARNERTSWPGTTWGPHPSPPPPHPHPPLPPPPTPPWPMDLAMAMHGNGHGPWPIWPWPVGHCQGHRPWAMAHGPWPWPMAHGSWPWDMEALSVKIISK
jgi:hypothetical protein